MHKKVLLGCFEALFSNSTALFLVGEVTRRWVVPVQSSNISALGLKLQYTEKGVVVEEVNDGLVSPGLCAASRSRSRWDSPFLASAWLADFENPNWFRRS